ncbi:MAG: D-alanine--D-alanine ligase [Verrucomicrobia bacterium]|nr:D-alanine--D-alanine ligase [Verrucomicrobiota bacterium]
MESRVMKDRRFNKVAVLMGGPSAEREVSLASGSAVADALEEYGYTVVRIDVTEENLHLPESVEAAFIALHGAFGEDGRIQRLLAEQGVPYTGSGPESSEASFNKLTTKEMLLAAGLPTPRYEVIESPEELTLPLPVVVKPVKQGSSIGIARVFRESEWPESFRKAAGFESGVMVEEYIEGRELTVGVVGESALPVLEIVAPEGYYDYDAKYTKGKTEYRVPAPIPDEITELCQDYAIRTFKVLDCRGLGRVDFRLRPDGSVFILELNSIPGFTATSLLPKAAKVAGVEFPELCHRILQMASV